LLCTAFDDLGKLPSALKNCEGIAYAHIETALSKHKCKDFQSYDVDPFIRYLICRLVPEKTYRTSSASKNKNPVLFVLPLMLVKDESKTQSLAKSESSTKDISPLRWQRAPGKLPYFNLTLLGGQAEIEGLGLDNSESGETFN